MSAGGASVLIDGTHQGDAALRRRNWRPFPVEAADLDAVMITHAHLGHVGMLPLLARFGVRRAGVPLTADRAAGRRC